MADKIARYTMTLKEREGPVIAVDQNGSEIEAESLGGPEIEWCRSWEVRRLEHEAAAMKAYIDIQDGHFKLEISLKIILGVGLLIGLFGLVATDMGWL